MPDVKLPPGYQLIDSPAAPNPPAAPPVQVPAGYKLLDTPGVGNTPVVTSTIKDDSGNTVAGSLWDSVKDFLSATWDGVNPMNAVHEYIDRPKQWQAVSDVLGTYQRADAEGRHGQLTPDEEARVREAMKVPLYDPGIAPPPTLEPVVQAGADAADGRFARAAGDLVGGYAIPYVAARVLRKTRSLGLIPGLKTENPTVIADAKFAHENDIPISAAVETGNEFVRHAQKAADMTILGSMEAEEANTKTRKAIDRVGKKLLDTVHESPTNPLMAGEAIHHQLREKVADSSRAARIAYAPWHELEQDPANMYRVWVSDDPETGKPVYRDIAMPVDMRPVKRALRPIYDRYQYTSTLADRSADPGLHALRNIVEKDDWKSAGTAELDLGALKEVVRNAGPEEFHGISEGMAKEAVKYLDAQIRRAARNAKTSRVEKLGPGSSAGAITAGGGVSPEAGAAAAGPVTSSISRNQTTSIDVPGESRTYPARYEIRELDSLNPSHDPQTFQARRSYPYVNDRDYTRTENQAKVVENSTPGTFRPLEVINDAPGATTGPPVVDAQGNVIGGNGRAMILGRVYNAGGKAADSYRAALTDRAGQFGLSSDQVAGMKKPVLVRVGEFQDPQTAISDLNKSGTNALRFEEQAVSDARRVSPETLSKIGARLDAQGSEATISSILDGKAGTEILQHLIDDGVVSPSERPRLVNGNILTPSGRDRVRSTLLGRFFDSPAQMDAVPDAVQAKIAKMTGPLVSVEGTPFALSDQVRSALGLIERAKTAGVGVDDFIHQGGLFATQEFPAPVVRLAQHLERTPTAKLMGAIRNYADDAQYANGGAGLFGDVPTPEESFAEHLGGDVPAAAAEVPPAAAGAAAGAESTAVVPAETQQARAQNVTREPVIAPVVEGRPAGDEALGSLLLGRRAALEKWRNADLLRVVRKEPVQAFDQATFARDAGVNHLRAIEKQTPGVLRQIGRAYLEQMFDVATNSDNPKPKSGLTSWVNMGDETKRLLFGSPAMVENLNRFMSLVVRVADNPNPSGSGIQALIGAQGAQLVMQPVRGSAVQLAARKVSRLLHSPQGGKLLTEGLKLTLEGSKDKGRLGWVMAQIARMAAQPDDKEDDGITDDAATAAAAAKQ